MSVEEARPKPRDANKDEVDGYDEVEQTGHDENQDPGHKGNQWLKMKRHYVVPANVQWVFQVDLEEWSEAFRSVPVPKKSNQRAPHVSPVPRIVLPRYGGHR
jgi:hypothetical protein